MGETASWGTVIGALLIHSWQAMPALLAWYVVLALLISATGFVRVVYFVSVGYAFSIAAMALVSLGLYHTDLTPLVTLHAVLLGLYGLRLGTFLVHRERQPSYQREREEVKQRGAGITLPVKFAIWLSVSLLYALMFSPCLFTLERLHTQGLGGGMPAVVGLVLMAGGLGTEAWADRQKSAYKKDNPKRFCDVGLFRLVRAPNYLGEVVFWLGNFVAGVAAYVGLLQWLAALIGLVCIVLIMLGSTKRLERQQGDRYGTREDYQAYIRSVPVLFPFLPIYTLKNVRVYLE